MELLVKLFPSLNKIAITTGHQKNESKKLGQYTNVPTPKAGNVKGGTIKKVAKVHMAHDDQSSKAKKENQGQEIKHVHKANKKCDRKILEQSAKVVKYQSEKLAKLYTNLLSQHKENQEDAIAFNTTKQVLNDVPKQNIYQSGVRHSYSNNAQIEEKMREQLGCNSPKQAKIEIKQCGEIPQNTKTLNRFIIGQNSPSAQKNVKAEITPQQKMQIPGFLHMTAPKAFFQFALHPNKIPQSRVDRAVIAHTQES